MDYASGDFRLQGNASGGRFFAFLRLPSRIRGHSGTSGVSWHNVCPCLVTEVER